MDNKFLTVSSPKNSRITVRACEGHFATNSAHRSHYIDIFDLTSSSSVAREAARELAVPYRADTFIDAIVYMDNTEILAAYLADELLQSGIRVINEGSEILLVSPILRPEGTFIFHQSVQERLKGKNILLLVASLSTGATAHQIVDGLNYYGCKLVGISAIFSAYPEVEGKKIYSLFDYADVPNYHFYKPEECELCREGKKIDALISSEGYTKY
jgi:orotate phosphoribosyltransferase